MVHQAVAAGYYLHGWIKGSTCFCNVFGFLLFSFNDLVTCLCYLSSLSFFRKHPLVSNYLFVFLLDISVCMMTSWSSFELCILISMHRSIKVGPVDLLTSNLHIDRYIKFEDKKRALVSRLLQYSLVHEVLGIPFDKIIIHRTAEGKPYLVWLLFCLVIIFIGPDLLSMYL